MKLDSLYTQHFINNEFVDSKSRQTFKTIDPSTEEVITVVQRGDALDVDEAVRSAKSAFKTWRDVSGPHRRDLLLTLSDLMLENIQFLADVESRDNGTPVSDTKDNISSSIRNLRYYAGWADKIQGKTIPLQDTDAIALTVHEPVGVVGCIIPWNFPIGMMIWKIAPLLATGCTAVVKSSEKTPLTALLLARLIQEAGYPPGVINVLSGYGHDCGKALARHPAVDKIAFTGSSDVGHDIVSYSAATNLKRVTLELGGKSALIVCDDADLDQAADAAHEGLFGNQGQSCCACSRIFVHTHIYDTFVQKCVERAKGIRMGIDQGPQVDEVQFEKILGYISSGMREGATCVLGGKRWGDIGYFIEPTVFTNVKDGMKIAREEIFGPVMQLLRFDTIEEAIQRANASKYGLAAGVCSTNISRAIGIAKRLQAGTVWVNCYNHFDPAAPFGGFKESGWGREKGQYALDNYTETKTIQFPVNHYDGTTGK